MNRNSDDEIEIIKKNVNLLGYGISENWLGYTERNKPFQKGIARKIIDIFSSAFSVEEITIVTSAVKVKDEIIDDDISIRNYLRKIENELISKEYVLFSDEDDEYVDGYSAAIINPTFRVIEDCSNQLLLKLSMLFFVDSSIDGHCFFVFKKKGLIAYPHEDTGFGFISFDNYRFESNVNDFFTKVKCDENFDVFIK